MKNKPFAPSLSTRTTVSLSLLAIAFLVCRLVRPIYWEDVWWHLGVGEYIWTHRSIPTTDIFSWTRFGAAWTNTEWLYEVVLYGLVRALGLSGVIFLKIILVATAFYFLDRRLRLWNAGSVERLIVLGLSFLGGWPFWVERADLSSLALLSALCFDIDRLPGESDGGLRLAVLWIFLFCLWPNIHGAFPFGLLVIGWRGIILLADRPGLGRRVLLTAVLCGAGTCLTPYGLYLPMRIYENIATRHLDQIPEWLPPHGLGFLSFFFSLGLAIACFVLKKKRTWDDAYAAGIFLLFADYTLRHQRFVHFFMVCAFPYAAQQWLKSPWRARIGQRLASWEKHALALSSLGLLMVCVRGAPAMRGGVNSSASGYIREACNFIETQAIQGPFYNDYKFGSYWIWRFKGTPPVFQDGRQATIEGYVRLIEATQEAQRSPDSWNTYADRLGIQAAIVKYPPQDGGIRPSPFDRFFPRTSWGLIYWDDISLLFVRRTLRNAALLRRWEYRAMKPDWNLESYLEQLHRGRLDRKAARKEIERNLALNPDCRRARVDLHWLDQADAPH